VHGSGVHFPQSFTAWACRKLRVPYPSLILFLGLVFFPPPPSGRWECGRVFLSAFFSPRPHVESFPLQEAGFVFTAPFLPVSAPVLPHSPGVQEDNHAVSAGSTFYGVPVSPPCCVDELKCVWSLFPLSPFVNDRKNTYNTKRAPLVFPLSLSPPRPLLGFWLKWGSE